MNEKKKKTERGMELASKAWNSQESFKLKMIENGNEG